MKDNTKRFSNRVDNYVKYRPSYPAQLIDYLLNEIGINKKAIVADIGSGTGIFSKLLINKVKTIYCVEPNNEMRLYSEEMFKSAKNSYVINGTAEATALNDNSIDFITVAQAFHWFNIRKTMKEFRRIIKANGIMILVWNNRLTNTEFLNTYEYGVQKYANDYNEVNHQNITEAEIRECFNSDMKKIKFNNFQEFDFNGVMGRLLSSSYAPLEGTENYIKLKEIVKEAFDKGAINGKVRFNYETKLYWGTL